MVDRFPRPEIARMLDHHKHARLRVQTLSDGDFGEVLENGEPLRRLLPQISFPLSLVLFIEYGHVVKSADQNYHALDLAHHGEAEGMDEVLPFGP